MAMTHTKAILVEIIALSQPAKIDFYTHFFRADKGDICYGDKILAIKIPELRKIIKTYFKTLALEDIQFFLDSEYNEVRFFGQQIIKEKYQSTKSIDEKSILIQYLLQHSKSINHWNLVDGIAPTIGDFWLLTNNLKQFNIYSAQQSIWLRRIAIVACLALTKTKNKVYIPLILEVIDNNKTHSHEYIQKAVGWILREVGKLDERSLIDYLKANWSVLSSTTRSYATEKLRITLDTKTLFSTSN
jgi:3-methyladenine DNA glycosylase AlkD